MEQYYYVFFGFFRQDEFSGTSNLLKNDVTPLPETAKAPSKKWRGVGRLASFWGGGFLTGATLVSGSVP